MRSIGENLDPVEYGVTEATQPESPHSLSDAYSVLARQF
jgi:hypothetical protein